MEDLIQESMAKGDFDNLSGKENLWKFSGCSYIDPMTHNLNRILIDNGYQTRMDPNAKGNKGYHWSTQRGNFSVKEKLGNPMTSAEQKQWNQVCEQFQENIKKLKANSMILI